jgi:hypothetical protein
MLFVAGIVLGLWQLMCGAALIFEQSKVYARCNNPQARRVAELCGVAWSLFGLLTILAVVNLEVVNLLVKAVLWSSVAFNACFSLAAGPLRLTPANPREKILVPLNTAIIAFAAVAMVIEL